jgi:hypothetical protein
MLGLKRDGYEAFDLIVNGGSGVDHSHTVPSGATQVCALAHIACHAWQF